MNSQFRNSNFGFVLYVAIIGLIVAATIFVIWYMTLGYKLGTYGPDTRLGSVYIGGLDSSEVVPKVEGKIDYWYQDDTIVFELSYQGYTYEFDRKLLLFNLQVSTYDIVDGETNELLVYIQPTDRTDIIEDISALPFLQGVIDNVDVQTLLIDMLEDASLMKSYSCKDVEDYLIDDTLSIAELNRSIFSIPEGVNIDQLIESINTLYEDGQIVANNKELFDVTNEFGSELNDSEMTVLSSAILDSILSTNFLISEVHYEENIDFTRYTIEDFPYYHRNAVINQLIGESFSFYNPNEADYYFMIEKISDTEGNLVLYGLPFEYEINVIIDETEVAFTTIYDDNYLLYQDGFNGVIIEVTREIVDIYGDSVSTDEVLFEFYPPIIEVTFEE